MSWAIVGGVAVAGLGLYSASEQADAAQNASDAQVGMGREQIAAQKEQFAAIQKLLLPYVQGGEKGLNEQLNLLGLNGAGAQGVSVNGIATSPQFSALAKSGEDAILQNASATGNLRGGNVQGALAQFRPQLLQQMIDQQYQRLGGITNIGQNAAAGVGNSGAATANNVSNILGQQGAALAGGQLAQGRAASGYSNALTSGLGTYLGLGGRGAMGQGPTPAFGSLPTLPDNLLTGGF